jgi:hypothetical protein
MWGVESAPAAPASSSAAGNSCPSFSIAIGKLYNSQNLVTSNGEPMIQTTQEQPKGSSEQQPPIGG